jgi:glycerol-3-phosphate dehydrogenase
MKPTTISVLQKCKQEKQRFATITGSVLGAVAGGVIGHQFGGGRGKDVATVVGALGGGYAGNQVQGAMQDIHDKDGQAPLLSVFGGKLTTYRKLAEHALEKLTPYYSNIGPAWTKGATLPGGDIGGNRDDYAASLRRRYPFISESLARHYARTNGSNSDQILGAAKEMSDLGEHFGHELYEAELRYLVEHEWVRRMDDALWRRTKEGMWLNAEQQSRVAQWLVMNGGKGELSLAS